MARDSRSPYYRKRILAAAAAVVVAAVGLIALFTRSPVQAGKGECPNPTKIELPIKA